MRILLGGLLLTLGLSAAGGEEKAPSPDRAPSDAVRFDLVRFRDRIEEDGTSSRTVEIHVLLRTAEAVTEFGQLVIPYVDGLGQVQIEKLALQKPDGRTVDAKNATNEDLNPFGTGSSIPADVRVKKVTIPGLEPGDLLTYQFVIRLKPLATGRIYGELKLAPMLGAPRQSYELDLPQKAEVRVRLRDELGAAWQEVPGPPDRRVRRLEVTIPWPNLDEPPDKARRQSMLEPDVSFTNFRTWPEVAAWWRDLARGRLDPDATIKAEAAAVAGSAATAREKVVALDRYVASRIRYLNVSFGIGRMQPRPALDVLTSRYGDCKDKHALLAALAAAIGIDVRPVLIHSTRSDLRDDVPSPQQFDHMISVARLGPDPGDWLWLDSTSPYFPPGYLATSLRDKRALLVEASGDGRIVRTPADPPLANRSEIELKGTMDSEGKLHAHALFRFRSDLEVPFRAGFSALPPDRWAEFVRMAFLSDWREPKATNVVVSDPTDVADAFRLEFDLEGGPDPDRTKPTWTLWIPLPPVGLPDPEGKAKSKTKAKPEEELELVPNEYSARVDLDLPEGITLQAPLSVALERPFGTFQSSYEVKGRHLTVLRKLEVKSHAVPADALKSYAAFYRAVDTDREQKFSVLGSVGANAGASATDLHQAGMAVYERKEYEEAIALLRKATEKDAKVENGFLDLGRVLRDNHQKFEAIAAFTRQIELEPFHESAYAERAYTLIDIGRWEEAEQDLTKQIEVAPFKAWSYERLGERRVSQGRFGEAAGYYARAAAIEPKEAQRWVDLGAAQWNAGQRDEARAALDRARGLEPADWLKVLAAKVYAGLGDATVASELAESSIGSLTERLSKLSSEDFGTKDLYRVDRLTEAWRLIGTAALSSGDETKAARYLNAAWKLGFLPEAGADLGTLRSKQGRFKEALDLLNMVSSIPTAKGTLPKDLQQRIVDLTRRVPGDATSINSLMDLRTVHLSCPVLKDLSEEALLLIGSDGRVLKVKGISPHQPTDLERQISRIGVLKLPTAAPDERTFKIVRRGLLACSQATDCALVLDIPGLEQTGLQVANPTFEATVVKPRQGTILRRGQRDQAIVVLRYNLKGMPDATVTLRVRDQSGKSLIDAPAPTGVVTGSGEVPRNGTFLVSPDATRVDISLEIKFVGADKAMPVAGATYSVQ